LDSNDYDADFEVPESLCNLLVVFVQHGGVSAAESICEI